ncbi:MAG: DUF3524 domain-containing protein, partial [Deltaproteobacteria bacterium]|nr:DUF3524 domain-containing protein [Deltaproteobacteria bacterium]
MRILYVEPFETGSHASFTRTLTQGIDAQWTALTLPGRHWKWRMRGAAVWAATTHMEALNAGHDLLLASSYLPLAELVGLCPTLAAIPRLLYFHENQLAYPQRSPTPGGRDHHFGFTQLVSALAATRCVFNSAYNRDSLLHHGRALLARMPDAVPRGWIERIEQSADVLPLPLSLPDVAPIPEVAPDDPLRAKGPLLLWNHRWEHDKNPEAFFAALRHLVDHQVPFRVAVCGQRFSRIPAVFEQAPAWLGDRIEHWGYCETASDYAALLGRAQLAISTADHEFFGVAMLEATHHGAFPMVPDRLAYPELFPAAHRYPHDAALADRLVAACTAWIRGEPLRADRRALTDP